MENFDVASSRAESEALLDSMIIDKAAVSDAETQGSEENSPYAGTLAEGSGVTSTSERTPSPTDEATAGERHAPSTAMLAGSSSSTTERTQDSRTSRSYARGTPETGSDLNDSERDDQSISRRRSSPKRIPRLPPIRVPSRGAQGMRIGRPGIGARTLSADMARRQRRNQQTTTQPSAEDEDAE
ncbi:Hypothetical protein D9617_3g018900 [Elsinoe fawcettii]|nr:Hypothetical protein D9617_3g018900 [Elsinoe fawcettii]